MEPRRRECAERAVRPLAWRITLAASVWLGMLASLSASGSEPNLRGHVDLAIPGVTLADLGPVVVYLERLDGAPTAVPPLAAARIVQDGARFSPSFAIVTRGQVVDMPNADAIYHNVFSFSKPNDFDLGLYPAGQSREVRFEHAGVVKIYCSIHEGMNATIFVAPGAYHARVGRSGRFVIEHVPPGRYRLSLWCEQLPGMSMEITVTADGDARVDVQWSPLSG